MYVLIISYLMSKVSWNASGKSNLQQKLCLSFTTRSMSYRRICRTPRHSDICLDGDGDKLYENGVPVDVVLAV